MALNILKCLLATTILCFVTLIGSYGQQNFTGVGTVACPLENNTLSPCVDVTSSLCLSSDSNCASQVVNSGVESFVVNTLPCNCTTYNNCPASCIFQPAPTTDGDEFFGPGYLSCPVSVYSEIADNQGSCSLDFDPTCPTISSCDFSKVGNLTVNTEFFYLDLACDCVIAIGCPSVCTVIDEIPKTTVTSGRIDFNGSGLVTCPIVDFQAVPCEPTPPSDKTLCGGCNTTLADTDYIYQIGDENATIFIPCKCMVMNDCPDTCSFTATDERTSAPNVGSVMEPNVPTSTGAPVQAPIRATSYAASPIHGRFVIVLFVQIVILGTVF